MDDQLLALRRLTYQLFVELGRGPSVDEVADASEMTRAEVEEGWRDLHSEHAIVLASNACEIRMANPFSGVPTPYRVHADNRWWYANCAWDAFGICAALKSDGRIETVCPDCNSEISVTVEGEMPSDPSLLFHCLVPAAQWWDDIVFT